MVATDAAGGLCLCGRGGDARRAARTALRAGAAPDRCLGDGAAAAHGSGGDGHALGAASAAGLARAGAAAAGAGYALVSGTLPDAFETARGTGCADLLVAPADPGAGAADRV